VVPGASVVLVVGGSSVVPVLVGVPVVPVGSSVVGDSVVVGSSALQAVRLRMAVQRARWRMEKLWPTTLSQAPAPPLRHFPGAGARGELLGATIAQASEDTRPMRIAWRTRPAT